MLKEAERKLDYELTILQFIGNAAASGNSHSKGRMVDLAPYDHERKLRVIFSLGGYGWYRRFVPGLWPAHLHIGSIFESRNNERGIDPVGFRQISSWDAVRDGLVSNAPDDFKFRPSPKQVWSLEDYRETFEKPEIKPTKVQLVRNEIVASISSLAEAISKMSDINEGRIRVHAQAQPLIEERRHLKKILAELPLK